MNEKQADEMIGFLRLIYGELVEMRQDFADFTNNNVQSMKATVEDITGQDSYSLRDVHQRLGDMAHSLAMIEINTAP